VGIAPRLLENAEPVDIGPMLDDVAVRNPGKGDLAAFQALAVRGNSEETTAAR
jgi:hypothetical protein